MNITNAFLYIQVGLSFIANASILLLTISTFYLTFLSKKIKYIGLSETISHNYGNCISVIIENRSARPIAISGISLIIENKYKVLVSDCDSPLIISPFSAQKITSKKYSYTDPDIIINKDDTSIEVTFLGRKRKKYIRYNREASRVSKEIKDSFPNVRIVTKRINDKIVPINAKYALIYNENNKRKTIFIFKNGAMHEDFFGTNFIPSENMSSNESVLTYFENRFKLLEQNFGLISIEENNKQLS